LEYAEVFAIDGVRDPSLLPKAGDPKAVPMKNVSLQVTSEQARLLKLAQDVGTIHLTLRAMNDKARLNEKDLFDPRVAEIPVAKTSEVRDLPPPVVAQPPAPEVKPEPDPKPGHKKWKIEIIAGADRRIEEVDLPDQEPVTLSNAKGS
jgi:Flp pilus assembly protein CpaB